jgi:hypothetical protein
MSLPPRMGDPITGKPRSYEEKLAMENAKLANAPPDPNRRIYLRVPFREKKVAIGFGAIFDTERNRWCCTQEQAIALKDVEPFKFWLPEEALPAAYRTPVNCSDKVTGTDREAFKRLTEAAKTATPEARPSSCTNPLSHQPTIPSRCASAGVPTRAAAAPSPARRSSASSSAPRS